MKKKTKVILITLIVIASVVVLGTIFGIVDYNRLKNGKDPIFSRSRWSYHLFDVEVASEENTNKSTDSVAVYSGLGYKIVVCNFCEKEVYVMPLGIGNLPQENLTCTQDNGYNDKKVIMYSLFEGKVDTIYTSYTVPAKSIEDEENYKGEFLEVENVTGCGREFENDMDLSGNISYTTYFSCDLSEMSDDDIKAVFGTNRDSIEQTKKEIIKNNPDMKCKE